MTPKNVRPAWIEINVDDRDPVATGPKSRTGQMNAKISVRSSGQVLPLLDIEAIGSGDGQTVLIRITDLRTGKAIFTERINQ
jgi:hypothetical protein